MSLVSKSTLAVVSVVVSVAIFAAGAKAAGSNAADKKISAAGLLVLDDFPSGWKATARSSSSEGDDAAAKTPVCKALVNARDKARKKGAHSESKTFDKSDEQFQNTVALLPSEVAATKLFGTYSGRKTQDCLATIGEAGIKANLVKAGKKANVSTTMSEVSGPEIGTASARHQLVVKVSGGDAVFAQKVFIDFVYVQNDRSVTVYQHSNAYEESQSMLDQLIDTTQRRLSAALTGQPVPAADEPAALGTAQTASDGATIAVYSVTPNVPGEYSGDGPYTVVDVQICAPKGASNSVDASAHGFQLVFPDNTSAETTYGGPDPQLHSSTLTDGACARGNVAFEPAQTTAPTKVVYDTPSDNGKPLAWRAS